MGVGMAHGSVRRGKDRRAGVGMGVAHGSVRGGEDRTRVDQRIGRGATSLEKARRVLKRVGHGGQEGLARCLDGAIEASQRAALRQGQARLDVVHGQQWLPLAGLHCCVCAQRPD